MIDKLLEQITFADIDRFVQEKWPEGKTIEYKRDTYGGKDDDKKELLKDVSSFANTLGGDILIGVDEDKGEPTGIPGITLSDVDKEKLRLDGIIRKGLEPRIEFGIHHVTTPTGTFVVIIRIKESFLFPHRVIYQKFGEFWARSSAGKYSMDTDELRRAFTLSDSIYEKMKDFRKSRVSLIQSGETPIPLMEGGKFIMHLVPVSSFRSRLKFDVANMPQLATQLPPIGVSSWDNRLNLDGHLSYGGGPDGEERRSYTQFFRNGIIEVVRTRIVNEFERNGRQHKVLDTSSYENDLVTDYGFFKQLWSGIRGLGIEPPIWCFLTFAGLKGARISSADNHDFKNHAFDRDVLFLPECLIEDLAVPPATVLRSTIDLVWNASGVVKQWS